MALGFLQNPGGVMRTADVEGAGIDAWTRTAGIPPTSSLVGGPGHEIDMYAMPYNVDHARGRIITNDAAPMLGPLGGPGANVMEDWRDVFNWQHSATPWLLLFSLAILGFMQFRLQARVGRGKHSVRAGAALG